jgi:hypothetical protein
MKRRCIKGNISSHAHFLQPARQLRGGEIVKTAKRVFQFRVAANRDDTVQRGLGRGV